MQAGLDIGNTRSKLGLFHSNGDIEIIYLERNADALSAAVGDYHITDLIVTSVVDELIEDEALIQKLDSFIWLSHVTPLPIELSYDTPETLGRDRIATAVGASVLFPKSHSLVIDSGTCMTVDFVRDGKIFEGGYIAPGIRMRWLAMHDYTARLPLVKDMPEWRLFGKTTSEALGVGGFGSLVFELEGFIYRIKEEYKELNVILTGGDGTFIFENIVHKIHLQPNLLMEGLREIQRYNAR